MGQNKFSQQKIKNLKILKSTNKTNKKKSQKKLYYMYLQRNFWIGIFCQKNLFVLMRGTYGI